MIVAVNKPVGMTSHDVIDQVRRVTGEQRVGHAGTLDPLASGVLVIGIGRESTKQLASIVAKEKEYLATVRLGATSTTDDAEGDVTPHPDPVKPDQQQVEAALNQFVGTINQTPPQYSAIKVSGRPAHRRMRVGETVELKPRPVEIKAIELIDYRWPDVQLRVVTGPGVYIRALARDLGEALSTGGYLTGLTRTRVGEYVIEDTISPEKTFLP